MISVLFKYSSSLSARQSIADLSVVHTKVIDMVDLDDSKKRFKEKTKLRSLSQNVTVILSYHPPPTLS